ncbi:MAG: ComF family protein [Lachnospiraceae bacterium]|nr:ComF family protein [Lachnospiraceae bacterium]
MGSDMGSRLKRIINKIRTLFYPPVCPLCEEVLKGGKTRICDRCRPKITYLTEPTCLKCGKEIDDIEKEYCDDCKVKPKSFVKGFPAMRYREPIKRSIVNFKYHNKSTFADCYALEIVKTHGKDIIEAAPEVLIPVPVHKSKLEKRGYNQAEVLAKSLGAYLNIPVDNTVLKRTVNTTPQKLLDNEERQKNLERAFISDKKQVQYKRIMLVDDIYTTGSTIEACTKVLKAAGVKEVYFTSICIGKD